MPPESIVRHVLSVTRGGDWPVQREALEAVLRRCASTQVRPLTGPGDWLARVHWVDGAPDHELRRWMRPTNGRGSSVTVPDSPPRRLALVDRLLGTLRDGNGEPALHALLREERARLVRQIQTASTRSRLRHALRTLKQSLYPYQHDGVERFFTSGRLLLADDMGLGKTAQAIAACHALWHTGRVRRGLLVVPAALKPQWLREWQLFTDAPATVVDGPPSQRRAAFQACRRSSRNGAWPLGTRRRWMEERRSEGPER